MVLEQRTGSLEEFGEAVNLDTERRNADRRPVKWHFTAADAGKKLKHLYLKI